MRRFCPKCGREGREAGFIRGFCRECYLSEHSIADVPKEIEVEQCKRCGMVRFRGSWHGQEENMLAEIAAGGVKPHELADADIKVEIRPMSNGTSVAEATITGRIEGRDVELKREILLKPKIMLCDGCMKMSSNYFEATIQIRFAAKPFRAQVEKNTALVGEILRAEKRHDPLAEMVSVRQVQNGVDVQVGSRRAAKLAAVALARKSRFPLKTSYSLKGVDSSGKPKKRLTYCVRF